MNPGALLREFWWLCYKENAYTTFKQRRCELIRLLYAHVSLHHSLSLRIRGLKSVFSITLRSASLALQKIKTFDGAFYEQNYAFCNITRSREFDHGKPNVIVIKI